MTFPLAYAPCDAPGCYPSATPHRHQSDGLGRLDGPVVSFEYRPAEAVHVVIRPRRGAERVISTFRTPDAALEWLDRTAAHIRQAMATDALR